MKKRLVFIVLLALALSACSIVNSQMNKFQGRHISNVFVRFGNPSRIYDDGFGGKVYVFTLYRGYYYPATSTTYTSVNGGIYGNQVSGTASTYTVFTPAIMASFDAYRVFWVDKNGYVYRWAWKGL